MLAVVLSLSAFGCNTGHYEEWQPVGRAGFGISTLPEETVNAQGFVRREKVQPDNSNLIVGVFVLLSVGGLLSAAIAYTLVHRRRSLIERAYNRSAPLRNGEMVIFGKVETDDGQPGIVVQVDQQGKEWYHKGTWNHSWNEVSRSIRSRPFLLRTANGELIRVEPSQNVKIHDTLSKTVRHNDTQRSRLAEVSHGEEIHIYGTVAGVTGAIQQGAYRDPGSIPVMTAPRFGAMRISSEQPGESADKRMRFHRGWAVVLAIWLVFSLTVVHGNFVTLSLDGDVVMVVPQATRQWREWIKPKNSAGYWRYHYDVRGTADGDTFEDEVGFSLYSQINGGTVSKIPFLRSSLRPDVMQYGSEPMTNEGVSILSVIVALCLLSSYPLSVRASRPWYDKKKFNEGGAGRLTR